MRLVTVHQMRELESQADKNGLTYERMMANAGLETAREVHQRYFSRQSHRVIGLIGSGNNGGDTLVALAHLAAWGWHTQAYLVKERGKNDALTEAYLKAGGKLLPAGEGGDFPALREGIIESDVLLDGILGTGAKLPLKKEIQDVLACILTIPDKPVVIAVDCPSGVDCDSGEAAPECLPAELTICMAAVKQGLLRQPALKLCGEILAVDIGLPGNLPAWQEAGTEVVDANLAAAWLPDRPADSHKGTFGTCLIAAGSINYCGAALLASQAAYRVGAGLVRTAIPGAIYDALAGSLPETTWLILPHTLGVLNAEGARIVRQNLERVSCMLLGPGWGLEEETLAFLKQLFGDSGAGNQMGFDMVQGKRARNESVNLPHLVIDADALKLLARIDHWEKKIGFAVLTPHPGEMAVLTGLPVEKIQADREKIACEYAAKWGQVVVLKGALTIIAAPDGRRALIPVANSALAKAGTGDVLAGMIAGYVAQGVEAFNAAALAAWLHARAGVAAARRIGTPASVAAGDLIAAIPLVIKQIGG